MFTSSYASYVDVQLGTSAWPAIVTFTWAWYNWTLILLFHEVRLFSVRLFIHRVLSELMALSDSLSCLCQRFETGLPAAVVLCHVWRYSDEICRKCRAWRYHHKAAAWRAESWQHKTILHRVYQSRRQILGTVKHLWLNFYWPVNDLLPCKFSSSASGSRNFFCWFFCTVLEYTVSLIFLLISNYFVKHCVLLCIVQY